MSCYLTGYFLNTLPVKENHEDSSERKNIFPSCDAQFAEAFLILREKQRLKIPQDQKSFNEKHRTQKKWVSFSRKRFSSEEAEALSAESEVDFPKRPLTILQSICFAIIGLTHHV
ncbi:hypothetical protein X953_19495 [Virgibacillus sp. SK37]|nr:hypothetical protein X953_19495 [Virgibacillus sp. SK37]MYL57031.1 hypothetical protein [Virgibacillus halodenitrificans]